MPTLCCVCGSDKITNCFAKKQISYYACRACGFVFSRPETNANFAATLEEYEPAYMTYLGPSANDEVNFTALVRWAGTYGRLDAGRVLDVGCGSGKFVRFLRRHSVDAYGSEPAAPLHTKFLADDPFFFHSSIEDMLHTVPVQKFSVVFACDVIEHVARPDLFLAAVSSILEPGGIVYITTPDAGSVLARMCGKQWHFYNKYHLSYFARKTLADLAARHGLHEVGYAHVGRWKTVGYLARYLRDFVVGSGARQASPPSLFDKMIVPVNVYDVMSVAFRKARVDAAQV